VGNPWGRTGTKEEQNYMPDEVQLSVISRLWICVILPLQLWTIGFSMLGNMFGEAAEMLGFQVLWRGWKSTHGGIVICENPLFSPASQAYGMLGEPNLLCGT
jgi:hypothetical protein